MVVLCFGDIFAKPGRQAVAASLPYLKRKYAPDIILGNVENLAGGRGVNRKTYDELLNLGFHGFTSGNHIWDNKEVVTIMETDRRIIRPANYPNPPRDRCPGFGWTLLEVDGNSLFLVNVMGRIFMDAIDCPFAAVDEALKHNQNNVPALVDLHADATSEMVAMGWHLDGRVSAVVGTHSHVQTADERLLHKGTAYITDIGMTGSFDSVIGMDRKVVVEKFVTKRPRRYQPANENPGVCCVVITIGEDNRAQSIERIRFTLAELEKLQ